MVSRVAPIIFLFFAMSLSASPQSIPVRGEQLIVPTKGYSCSGKGDLSVFGRFIDPLTGNGVPGAKVYLDFNDRTDPDSSTTDSEGRYCIRYSLQKVKTTLLFDYRGTSCVAGISGSESHFINKLVDSACSQFTAHAVALSADLGLYRNLPKEILPIQLRLTNQTGSAIQVLSAALQPAHIAGASGSTLLGGQSEISPIDPELVASATAGRRAEVSILRIGRFSLLNLSPAGADSDAAILKLGLRDNEVIAKDSSVVRVIFVAKDLLTQSTATNSQGKGAQVDIGNVVIRFSRISTEDRTETAMDQLLGSDLGGQATTTKPAVSSARLSLVIPVEGGTH